MEPIVDVFGTQTSAAGLSFGLRGVVDWSAQQPFLDVFKTARDWHGHTDSQWGAYRAEDLEALGVLDAQGWITGLPDGVDRIETFILTEMPVEAHYTAGTYRLSYDGAGEITVLGAEIVSQSDGEIWFNHTPTGSGMVTVSISGTDPQNTGDYLRNISVVKQEHIPAYEAGELFNPLWLDLIRDAHALRFMDWQETNNSTLQSWSDRPTPDHYSYAEGVPVEVMVALANATGTEPWFNIPWNADETYIRNFASYVRDNLDPDLRAHFELSNEVWNWQFDQAQDAHLAAQDRFGQALGDGWVQEYGARSAEMARILDSVYAGAEEQLVKVISTHTYWPGLEASVLEAPAWQALSPDNAAPALSFDTYAITGYFGNSLGSDAKAPLVLDWIAQSTDQARQDAAAQGLSGTAAEAYVAAHRFDLATDLALRELRDGSITGDDTDSLQGLFELFAYHKAVADAHGLDLVMYEGGTHVVGIGEWVNNDLLTEFFIHLNYSDGMGQLYTELFEGWEAAGGTLFNVFVDVYEPNKWGSWGSLRHLEDTTARHDAVTEFLQNNPAADSAKDGITGTASFDSPPAPETETETETGAEPDTGDDPGQAAAPPPAPETGPAPAQSPPSPIAPVQQGDVVTLSGAQSHYTLRISDGTIVIEDRRAGGEGARALSAEQRLEFAETLPIFGTGGVPIDLFDGIAQLSTDAIEELTELYIAYFNRAPDAIGLFFWGNQLADGLSMRKIAELFFDQPETRALYGTTTDLTALVTSVYQNVLGRAPDAEGMTFWRTQLETNDAITPATLIQEILAGAKAPTGSPDDAAFLANKVALGGHFAITRGMSDIQDARMVMQTFNGSQISLATAKAQTDAAYDDAFSNSNSEFILKLIGQNQTELEFF